MRFRVLAISGSLRGSSHNSALLRAAVNRLPAEADAVLFDQIAEIPAFDADLEDGPAPDAVEELREAMRSADAVLIATPEYNGSVPGALKNALDWASRPAGQSALSGVPAAVVGASPGQFGALWAQAELRKVLAGMGGRVVDLDLPAAEAHRLERDESDALVLPPELEGRLDEVLTALLDSARERREALSGRQALAA